LAEEIEKEFDFVVELESGELHSFDVFFDDKLIFSKDRAGRFPVPEEIIDLIRATGKSE
jgi:hypothetical protein